jgi:hypothetical protein
MALFLVCRFIPDLVFRFPVPIVLIIILTLRTLQLSCRGLAGTLDKRRFTSNRTLMLLTVAEKHAELRKLHSDF